MPDTINDSPSLLCPTPCGQEHRRRNVHSRDLGAFERCRDRVGAITASNLQNPFGAERPGEMEYRIPLNLFCQTAQP